MEKRLLVDTHAHFTMADIDGFVESAKAGNVKILAVGGSSDANSAAVSAFERNKDWVRAAAGFDWSSSEKFSEDSVLAELRIVAESLSAVGELGLDLHLGDDAPDSMRQADFLCAQIYFAEELGRPFILHTREAESLTVDVLRSLKRDLNGVVHSFTGNRDFARKLLDLGLYISFSGISTFKSADIIRDAVKYVPVDRILVETDSPYLAPVPLRGKGCRPEFVRHTADFIAKLRGVSCELFAEQTTSNAFQLFGKW